MTEATTSGRPTQKLPDGRRGLGGAGLPSGQRREEHPGRHDRGVIVVWLGLVALAVAVAFRHRSQPSGREWWWALWWAAAGFLVSISALAALDFGIFLFPPAAVLLLWVARRSPRLPQAAGFLAGLGASGLLVLLT